MEQLIHITATYSNAVLLVVLTNVSDFAKKLDLPIPQPITMVQVQSFKPHPFKNYFGGVLTLTNGDRFFQDQGYIDGFYGRKNYLMPPDDMDWEIVREQWITNFWGQMSMTTNEVIEFARDALRKLGYDPKKLHADGPPTSFSGPHVHEGKTFPFCDLEWRSDKSKGNNFITIDVNAEKKQIVRLSLTSTNAWRPDPKIDVEPELETNYHKPLQGMFIRSNAPARLQPSRPSGLHPPTNSPAQSTNSIQ